LRSRNIKPGFFTNEYLAELDPLARILFEGLWCLADREGRLEDRPKKIKVEVLPYDDVDVDHLLRFLEGKFILRYQKDGEKYIQVITFLKHQTPHHREKASEIPPPDSDESLPRQGISKASTEQGTAWPVLSPSDSLIPDSFNLIPDSCRKSQASCDNTQDGDVSTQERYVEGTDPYDLALELRELILENNPKSSAPIPGTKGFQCWCLVLDRMIRLDKRSPGEIAAIIHWSQKDDFWCTNILSPGKLRKQYDTLYLQAKKAGANLEMEKA